MAATASRDKISELPDGLLAHILSFAPAKEAASTAVLSRRWRSLWLQSGALNLDTRSYDRAHATTLRITVHNTESSAISKKRRAFSRGARQALDAMWSRHRAASAAPPLQRIAVTAAELTYKRCGGFVADVLPSVLGHPAASRLEEFRVACVPDTRGYSLWGKDEGKRGELYELWPGSLPCAETLRMLDLTDCKLSPPTSQPQIQHQTPPNVILPPQPRMPPPPPNIIRPRPLPPPPHMAPPPPPLNIIRPPTFPLMPMPPPPLPHRNNYIPPQYMPTMPPPLNHMRPPPPLPRAAFQLLPDSTHQPARLPSTSFPSLTSLRLHCCKLALNDLQDMIHAAPRLASLKLKKVFFVGLGAHGSANSFRLHCQTATDLALVFDTDCNFTNVELDVPQLRSLHYAGKLAEDSSFALKSPTPHLARVDLYITVIGNGNGHRSFRRPDPDGPSKDVKHGAPFWRFLGSICHCKSLKLKCRLIENILIHPHEEAKLLPTFTNLTQLEVKATYTDGEHKDVATLLSYLLCCCPVISELKLNFAQLPFHFKWNPEAGLSWDQKARLAMKRSMNKLKMHSSLMILVDDHYDDDGVQGFPDLPGWTESSFTCVRNSLRKLFLEFSMEQRDCFEIQLIRFFVENALLLDQVYVGDGDQDLRDHINYKVAKWRANSLRRNQLMKSEFKVYDHREKEVPSYVHNARKYWSTFGSHQVKRQKTINQA